MMTCPHCQRTEQQVKIGFNPSGSQRYRCKVCRRKYTPKPKPQGYSAALRQRAVQMYVDGLNFRRIARHLKVAPQSVVNWVNARAQEVPDLPPSPAAPHDVHELDELFTFVGEKKTKSTSSRR
jgi:transposase-like protein